MQEHAQQLVPRGPLHASSQEDVKSRILLETQATKLRNCMESQHYAGSPASIPREAFQGFIAVHIGAGRHSRKAEQQYRDGMLLSSIVTSTRNLICVLDLLNASHAWRLDDATLLA